MRVLLLLLTVFGSWLRHHSGLGEGDALIIGASKIPHLKANLESFKEGGPLPETLLEVLDEGALIAKPAWPAYHRSNNDYKALPRK